METSKDTYQYLEIKNNVPTVLLSLEQAAERIKGLTTPVVVKPDYIALQKRVLVGSKDKRNIYTALVGGVTRLIDQVSTSPDAFFIRGFNLDYTPTLGAKPSGITTPWGGLAEPAGQVKPEGYRIRYPKGATSEKERYYELSDQPDEVFTAPAPTKPVAPVTPAVPVTPVTEEPKGNQGTTVSWKVGDLFTGTPNSAS